MEMEPNKLINKSIRYYNSHKYSDVVKLLEKEIFFYKNYYFYHYILGMSYLRMGNLGNAQTYLKKAYTLNPTEPDVKQSIAILLAAQGKEDKAIQIWLKMIEENQEIKRSELSLETIRKNPIQGALFMNKNKIYAKLFPEIKVKTGQNLSKLIRILLTVAGFAFSLISIFLFIHSKETTTLTPNDFKAKEKKAINNIAAYIDDIKINEKEKIENHEGQFVFILTETEIKNSFQKIKTHLKKGKDNFARIEINKILNSNASESIKLKAKNLASFISRPDFITFDDYLVLKEIKKNPLIYSNIYVKWEGITNNIEKKDNITYFDFYVGYNKNTLEGIITTKTTFDIDINFKDCVEILGQIDYNYNTNTLTLNAITIRKIEKQKG
ncbi:Tetratricopeptide repeat family protein [Borrelia nietonii YOR]|uniref:Tetratricopeptide repeat family protein n=2 Tax=Borreliaceae TaxID=1643685 RepID=A0ABM5PHI6_9SPIR|nr:Tetratricopeptide repeat family protein [Borrelia nietonii YOR]AHH13636.1 Tetratricopeptide repeat family protein [Borrelia hermsii MTW]